VSSYADRVPEDGDDKQTLTIGELFPANDLVAQWVFGLTVLAQDLAVLFEPLKRAQIDDDQRARLFFYRQMLTKLYEARWLVHDAVTQAELEPFAARLLKTATGLDLRDYYLRPDPDTRSVIENLYAELRHQSVHYMRVGTAEFRDTLAAYARYPARVVLGKEEGRPTVEFQWAEVVSTMGLLGDPLDPEFLARMRRSEKLAAAVLQAWLMLTPVALIGYAFERGIDTNRLGDTPRPD
jgi:hypothetical protein